MTRIRFDKLVRKSGLRNVDLAFRLRVTKGWVSMLRSGRARPSLGLARLIAVVLGWSSSDTIKFGWSIKKRKLKP